MMKVAPFPFSFLGLLAVAALALPAHAVTTVPPGNRHIEQPLIPGGSVKRSRKTTFEKKYLKIRNLLARDRKLMGKIKHAAETFGIDPIHVLGALVGEHTYNVDAKDRLQTYYVKALAYLGQDLTFKYEDTTVSQLVTQPAFSECGSHNKGYQHWSCIELVWDRSYRGKNIAGRQWPNNRFGAVFFQPYYAGQTFGLGQLNPLTALKLNDMVRQRVPREPKLSVDNAPEIYSRIMNPDSTLLYMAAALRNGIDSYSRIADMNIEGNPGITATLYNLGNVTTRAATLKSKNDQLEANGEEPVLPEENYYGWLVNQKLPDLQSLL